MAHAFFGRERARISRRFSLSIIARASRSILACPSDGAIAWLASNSRRKRGKDQTSSGEGINVLALYAPANRNVDARYMIFNSRAETRVHLTMAGQMKRKVS